MANTRHQAREWAVQFLFQLDFNEPEDIAEDRDLFWEEKSEAFKDDPVDFVKGRRFAEELIDGVLKERKDIDERLDRYADKWDVHRLSGVDRNVLRLGLYELFYRNDVPPVVTLNEAIDLAKELSSEDSGKFVNGVLDRALKDVDRPLRSGGKAGRPNG